MEFNYKVWCLNKLTKTEFAIYDIICDLNVGLTSLKTICNYASSDPLTVRRTLKNLEEKKLLLAHTDGSIFILWIRSHPEEEVPSKEALLNEVSTVVRSPEGNEHLILPGKIDEFAKKFSIVPMTLWGLVNGKYKTNRQGWELVKSFSVPEKKEIAPNDAIALITKLTNDNNSLSEECSGLKKENHELKIENNSLKSMICEERTRPGTVAVSVKYLNQLKTDIASLKNENAWLKKGVAS